jgi:uncharacterized protein
MPEMTKYRHGTPNWVDVSTPDIAASAAFYGAMFGWDHLDLGPETGHYGFFSKGGKNVAGIGPAMEGIPPHWSTYIAVDDVDAAAAKVSDAGGVVIAPPMDLPNNSGRMSFVSDPAGAMVGLYQGNDHIGSQLVNEEGTLVWNELTSRDLPGSLKFLKAVVGDDATEMEGSEGGYYLIEAGGRMVAGSMVMTDEWPAEIPSNWMTYFMTADVDGAASKATQLGGSVLVPPQDMAVGRFAVISDPVGATFSVMSLHQVDDPNS